MKPHFKSVPLASISCDFTLKRPPFHIGNYGRFCKFDLVFKPHFSPPQIRPKPHVPESQPMFSHRQKSALGTDIFCKNLGKSGLGTDSSPKTTLGPSGGEGNPRFTTPTSFAWFKRWLTSGSGPCRRVFGRFWSGLLPDWCAFVSIGG